MDFIAHLMVLFMGFVSKVLILAIGLDFDSRLFDSGRRLFG